MRLQSPVETAGGTMSSAPMVLIDIRTGEGVIGRSYVRCYTPTALGPLAHLIANLEPLLNGQAADPQSVDAILQRHFRLLGPQGLTGIAMAGIDMALWDLLAKARCLPLVEFLGGTRTAVAAYASLRTMSPAAAASEAHELRERGFDAIKVKIGRGTLADDLETIRAVRNAIGSDAKLLVDYNQSLTVTEAIERGRALDAEGLYWIEEPTRADDFAGHAHIASALRTPVQLGENWWGVHDMEKSITAAASDHVMFDVMKLGGVTGWLAAAAVASTCALPVSSHTFPEYSVHLLGVTPTAHYLEYLDHAGPILLEPIVVQNGFALPPNRPGAGIEWNEERIATLPRI